MITGAIEAHNKHHLSCIDIHGAYLHALTDKEEITILRGPFAELVVTIDPELYCRLVTYGSKGVALLYVK